MGDETWLRPTRAAEVAGRPWIGLAVAVGLAAAPSAAQEIPAPQQTPTAPIPSIGVWGGAGDYCVKRMRVRAPDGVEALSFGSGVELRRAGAEEKFAEIQVFDDDGSLPDFDGFFSAFSLICPAGATLGETRDRVEASGGALTRGAKRCVGDGVDLGVAFARGDYAFQGAAYDVTVLVWHGDRAFAVGGHQFDAAELIGADEALAVFETVTDALTPCRPR